MTEAPKPQPAGLAGLFGGGLLGKPAPAPPKPTLTFEELEKKREENLAYKESEDKEERDKFQDNSTKTQRCKGYEQMKNKVSAYESKRNKVLDKREAIRLFKEQKEKEDQIQFKLH